MRRFWRGCMLALMLTLPWGVHAQSGDAPPRAIPYKEESAMAGSLWRASLGLLGLAAIAVALIYGYKRIPKFTARTASKRLKVVESLRLSPRTTLFLVEMDHKTMLLSLNAQEAQVLVPPEHAPPHPSGDVAV